MNTRFNGEHINSSTRKLLREDGDVKKVSSILGKKLQH